MARIDELEHMPQGEREQLKRDVAAARPQDRAILAAMINKLSLPAGEEGTAKQAPPAREVQPAFVHPTAPQPAPPQAEPAQPDEPVHAPPADDHQSTRRTTQRRPAERVVEVAPPAEPEPPREFPNPLIIGKLPGPAEPLPGPMPLAPYAPPPYATYPMTATPHAPPLPPPGGFAQQAQPPSPPAPQPGAIPPAAAKAWRTCLREAIDELERELKANETVGKPPVTAGKQGEVQTVSAEMPADRGEREVLLRLLKLAAGRRDEAVRRAAALPAGEQEFWTHQMHTLATLLDPDGAPVPSRRAALALKALRDAEAELAAESSLEVRNLAFCTEVQAFGSFKRFAAAEFEPGQEVLLYAEIDNFRSLETKGGYQTSLQGSYHVLEAGGRSVAEHNFPVDEDFCTSRRRDFFIPFRLYLPKLAPGDYSLQLTVEDTLAKKFGQGTIAFRIKGRR
jgi:hypothetical protein